MKWERTAAEAQDERAATLCCQCVAASFTLALQQAIGQLKILMLGSEGSHH